MIPFLLHARASGGSPPGVVVNPPGWAGDSYEAASYQTSGTATATLTFTLKSDGTYTVTVTNESGTTTLESGSWHSSPAAGVGTGFEAKYTVSSSSGAGTVSNGAVAFASLSGDRSFSLTVTRSTFGVSTGTRGVLVEIKPTGGVVAGSGTWSGTATAEVG